jgi:ribose-phosphate pyrophosphokinase
MILNLVYPEKSDIKFKINIFPDGQQSLDITDFLYAAYLDKTVQISSRLNNFRDLELIICANQALKNLGVSHVNLYVPYFMGARSDRQFHVGGVNYLKQVICPIINSQNFSHVIVIDPHSDVLEACLNNFTKLDNIELVDDALSYLIKEDEDNQIALVSPDAGALKKIYDIAKHFGINNVTTASKVREMSTGTILRTELPTMNLEGIKHIVIIDDICDGGRTFIELAKAIRQQTNLPIYLIVTHGIFSGGYEKLSDELDGIFCTNSFKDINFKTVKVQSRQQSEDFVKQLNIF